MALLYDVLQGPDSRDPVCTQRPPELCSPQLNQGIEGLRIAVADGYFATGAAPEAMDAVEIVAKALTNVLDCGISTEKTTNPPKIGGLATVTIPESDRAGLRHLSLPLARGETCIWTICDRALKTSILPRAIAF